MKSGLNILAIVLSLTLLVIGCQTTSQGSKTYTRQQAQQALTVYYGTVLKVAEVQIQAEETGAGAVVGGVAGGVYTVAGDCLSADLGDGGCEDAEVEQQASRLAKTVDVVGVEREPCAPVEGVAAAGLGPAGEAGANKESPGLPGRIPLHITQRQRPRADQAH